MPLESGLTKTLCRKNAYGRPQGATRDESFVLNEHETGFPSAVPLGGLRFCADSGRSGAVTFKTKEGTMSWKPTVLRCAYVSAVTTILVLVPADFSPSRGLTQRGACGADGACAREAGSVCAGDGQVLYDYYLQRDPDFPGN